jgi:hypothetical protein
VQARWFILASTTLLLAASPAAACGAHGTAQDPLAVAPGNVFISLLAVGIYSFSFFYTAHANFRLNQRGFQVLPSNLNAPPPDTSPDAKSIAPIPAPKH